MTEEKEADHVLIKRGLYYRPNGNGYTGLKSEAGLYHASYALGFDGVLAVPFADAPVFAPACWEETKIAYFEAALATARAEAEALRERADALALQADEWEGKYAAVSEMNAQLRGEVERLGRALREIDRMNDHPKWFRQSVNDIIGYAFRARNEGEGA